MHGPEKCARKDVRRTPLHPAPWLVVWFLTLPAMAEMEAPDIPPDIRRTELELRIAGMLLEEAAREGVPAPTSEGPTIPLYAVAWELPEPYAGMLPTRDVWGNPYVLIRGERMLMVSPGIDGLLDYPYADDENEESDLLVALRDDVVADAHGLLSAPRVLRWQQRRSMADLRSIGVATEVFAIDRNAYPGPTDGFVPIEWLEGDLRPFLSRIPLLDGWGEPYLFWSDGVEYYLISFGADGEPDQPYGGLESPRDEIVAAGAVEDPGRDIIYKSGGFVQWPESLAP